MKIFPCNEHHLAIRVIAVPENLNKNRKKTFKENNEIKKLTLTCDKILDRLLHPWPTDKSIPNGLTMFGSRKAGSFCNCSGSKLHSIDESLEEKKNNERVKFKYIYQNFSCKRR
jgi:hypothetical protein